MGNRNLKIGNGELGCGMQNKLLYRGMGNTRQGISNATNGGPDGFHHKTNFLSTLLLF